MTLIKKENAIEAIQTAYCKPCKERGDDHNEVRCRACEFDCAMMQIDIVPSAEAEWIPCSERLPRTGDDLLVTFSDGEVDIVISARPKAWVQYEEANNLIFPVAWMPLPKPYREEIEVEK